MSSPRVRWATVNDRNAIVVLVRAAFTSDGHDGQQEVDIVEATWSATTAADCYELVAELEGLIVGHVLAAPGWLGHGTVVGVAPLCVAPANQRAGIGIALMTELLERLEAAGHPLAVLLGNPAYYERFGFEPAASLGLWYRPAAAGNPHFMVRRFAAFDPSLRGEFAYCWEVRLGDRGDMT